MVTKSSLAEGGSKYCRIFIGFNKTLRSGQYRAFLPLLGAKESNVFKDRSFAVYPPLFTQDFRAEPRASPNPALLFAPCLPPLRGAQNRATGSLMPQKRG